MSKAANVAAAIAQGDGRDAFGQSLYLVVRGGSALWEYQFRQDKRLRTLSFGSAVGLAPVTLTAARAARAEAWLARRNGTMPAARPALTATAPAGPGSGKTFADIVGEYINAKGSQWRGGADGHEGRLYKSLVNTSLALIPINTIATADILAALEPWAGKASAKRIRGRIERVIDFATALGYRSGENPARYKGHLAHILPTDNGVEKHHAALPYQQVPKLMKQLGNDSADRALGFTILTAARRGETLGATWSEIVGDEWVIPSNRMKAGREHRVPLTKAALALLGKRGADDAYVFPGNGVRPLYPTRMQEVLERLAPGYKTHGLRSTFRTWVAEQTDFPGELAEMALAHAVGSAIERTYKRTTLIEKRRALMAAWAKYAC